MNLLIYQLKKVFWLSTYLATCLSVSCCKNIAVFVVHVLARKSEDVEWDKGSEILL